MKTKTFYRKKILIAIALLAAAAVFLLICLLFRLPREQKEDFKRLSTESYDSAFLSMFSTEYYLEEDFAYWRGMDLVKTNYVIPDYSTLEKYMKEIATSGNTIHTIYLGIRPDKMDCYKLLDLLLTYPGVTFEIILSNPSLDYWLALSDQEYRTILASYRDFAAALLDYPNIGIYFFGDREWMISNPGNYKDYFTNTGTSASTIMLNADSGHSFVLNADNLDASFAALGALITKERTSQTEYPDLSGESIIFLGDSVVANYRGSLSIPGVVAGLTNANVYNLGLGGGNAVKSYEADNCSLNDVCNAIVNRDSSLMPLDSTVSQDISLLQNFDAYLILEEPENPCFVINYALNDYFIGAPITTEDPYDIHSYNGAIRTAVQTLREAYPNSTIMLMTPNFTSYFGNGTDYRFEATHVVKDYADALIALSEELDVLLLDNFNELGINAQNHPTYLADGCHPNELGRFLVGQRIALKLGEEK